MENKETIIRVNSIVPLTSKAGLNYHVIKADECDYSCFNKELVAELQKHKGKEVRITYAESEDKNFRNIRTCLGEVSVDKAKEDFEANKFTESRSMKDTSIYTSYAKDIFIELKGKPMVMESKATNTEIMSQAIAVVKQAREAFK